MHLKSWIFIWDWLSWIVNISSRTSSNVSTVCDLSLTTASDKNSQPKRPPKSLDFAIDYKKLDTNGK
ncbi:unnamed protein product [Bursaphelenchus xylophilus]|uniref:(pine wood nematode) hypothetical protein n=1 Tax=Bursaphelenchus xylophilus TaxID=6326 RepID=A0A1I7RTQ5_BURXY|nr:unnamed protein product [Bursaphelenchus xylophilus]CAG9122216.1 unnamed protein product [Bursaphelenchus xylophilus]